MSNFKGKKPSWLARRIIAVALSAAMILSNMASSNMSVYATELPAESAAAEDTSAGTDNAKPEADAPAVEDSTGRTEEAEGAEASSSKGDTAAADDSSLNKDTDKNTAPESTKAAEKAEVDENSNEASEQETSKKEIDNKVTIHEFKAEVELGEIGTTAPTNIVALEKTFANGYFVLKGNEDAVRGKSSTFSLQLSQNKKNWLQFTTANTATVKVNATSTGSSETNISDIALYDSNDSPIAEKDNLTQVAKTTPKMFTYENVPVGTYKVIVPTNTRGTRILSVVVEEAETGSGDTPPVQPDRTHWNTVVAPAITSAAQDTDAASGALKDTVTVKLTADIAAGKGEKVDVILCNESGAAIKDSADKEISVQGIKDGDNYKATFDAAKLTASGKYTFKAVLSRKGANESDPDETKDSALSSVVGYILSLTKPVIAASYKEKNAGGKGVVKVSWDEVKEADYYVIKASYTDDANKDKVTIADVKVPKADAASGKFEKELTVNMDSAVSVTVTAYREAYDTVDEADRVSGNHMSEASAAAAVAVTEQKTPVYTVDLSGGLMTGTTYKGKDSKNQDENDDILTFTVMENMPLQKDGYVQGSKPAKYTKPDGTSSNCTGQIPADESSTFVITAVKSAKITFKLKATNKSYYLVNESGRYDKVKEDSIPNELSFKLKAGEKYYFYAGNGSKLMVYEISYSKEYVHDEDLSGGLVTTNTYGKEGLATFTVMENMPLQKDGYVQGSKPAKYTKPDGTSSNCTGQIPADESSTFVITAVKSAEITFKLKATNKSYYLVNESGRYDKVKEDSIPDELSFKLKAGEKYYFYAGNGSKLMVYNIYLAEWYSGEEAPIDRGNWDTDVEAPEIVSAVQEEKDGKKTGKIKVTVKGVINKIGKGADSIKAEMYDADDVSVLGADAQPIKIADEITTNTKADAEGNHLTTFEFTPTTTGKYRFKAILSRKDEKDADGNVTATYQDKKSDLTKEDTAFILPLAKPELSTLMNLDKDADGKGGIKASWGAVDEADRYILYVKNAENTELAKTETKGTAAEITGLELNAAVKVSVIAYRGEGTADASPESDAKDITITGEKPYDYLFDANDYDVADYTEGKIPAGTKLGAGDYYTLVNSTTDVAILKYLASAGTYLELGKYAGSGLRFSVYGETADVSFTVASTGSSNESAFGLVNSNGQLVTGSIIGAGSKTEASKVVEADSATKGNAYIASGTNTCTIEYKGLPKGTYTFLSPYTSGRNRGGRLHKAVVYDTALPPARDDWGKINAPIISQIKYVKGEPKITVTASGYIGYDGADSVMVEMLDASGAVVDSKISAQDSTFAGDVRTDVPLTYEFVPKASGDYSFRASLVRKGADNIAMAEEASQYKVSNFVLPLAQPSVKSMTNLAAAAAAEEAAEPAPQGSLEVIFDGVDEADYYVVAAFKSKDFNSADAYIDIETVESADMLKRVTDKEKAYTVTLENLPQGECYVTVQAFRNADSALKLTADTTTITRNTEADKVTVTTDIKSTLELKAEALKADAANAGKTDEEINTAAKAALGAAAPTDKGSAVAVARSKAYAPTASKYVNGKNDTRWSHSVFGSNTTRATFDRTKLNEFDKAYAADDAKAVPSNGYIEKVFTEGDKKGDLQSVTLWSENGRGKVVPASTDGLSYYYTKINPAQNNFSLSALIHVKSWTMSNGQDGFGMMVSDTVGKDGDEGNAWMNAYQLLASKIQYSWVRYDAETNTPGYVTNAAGNGTTIMRYEMKLGVGWNSKEGATAADVAKIKTGALTAPVNFVTNSGTLETSAGDNDKFTGPYNVIGNEFGGSQIISVNDKSELLTDFRFQIQKYDNAYVLRYLSKDAVDKAVIEAAEAGKPEAQKTKFYELNGKTYKLLGEQTFSDANNNKLTQIDKNAIYAGFFAARNARIEISEIDLQLTPTGEENQIPTTYIDPTVVVSSMEYSNTSRYELLLTANFDGVMTVYKEQNGTKTAVATAKAVKAGVKNNFIVELEPGTTQFTYYAEPNKDYTPGENQALSNFNMVTNETLPHKVSYGVFEGSTIYAAPNGSRIGTSATVEGTEYPAGSEKNPTNVYDAVNYAQPGQTILLAGGVYDLVNDTNNAVTMPNGEKRAANILIGKKHDGAPKAYITMKAAPDAVDNGTTNNRPILDFGKNTFKNDTAFTIAGNYWRFEGFDVVHSKNGQKGILLAGSHNVLSDMRTYYNGNTGIQVAKYGNDGRADWPSYNTLINCSSFMNYDSGYEDADGFAAKLTCGDGNRFIGCISAYNADDGWDLFAKVETGSIGVVTIENCLAFKNGYLFGKEGYYGAGSDWIMEPTDITTVRSFYNKNTPIVDAGNGNGFKLGGDSMIGYHVLRNSIAFGNKSKGIDSNSCPDIQVYNCVSFNNEVNNVALYTGGAPNTDYYVNGLVSFKDSTTKSGYATTENIKPVGAQNMNKIYSADNYYWNGSKAVNKDGAAFDTARYTSTDMNAAIFGGIKRTADGSIDLGGFLTLKDGASTVGGSNPDEAFDAGDADVYVFASDYRTLGEIELGGAFANAAAKKLAAAGYNWDDNDGLPIYTNTYSGSSADFTVKCDGKPDRNVTVHFITLAGAELVYSGDVNTNGVLDANENWTLEAVPVISPAVEPEMALAGLSAEIIEETGRISIMPNGDGTAKNSLTVANGKVTAEAVGVNGEARVKAVVKLKTANKLETQTANLAFKVSDGLGIKFDSINALAGGVAWTADNDNIVVNLPLMDEKNFTLENIHFADNANGGALMDFGRGVNIKVNDTNVIKLKSVSLRNDEQGADATFTVVNKRLYGGTATVTVTSKADSSLSRVYTVVLKNTADGRYTWNAGAIKLDKAKTAGVQLTALGIEQGVTDMQITVDEVYNGRIVKASAKLDDSYKAYFETVKVTGDVYELRTTPAAVKGLEKGTYTVIYGASAKAADGTPLYTTFEPVTVQVAETIPVVKLKQTKRVNLFYKKGTAANIGSLTASSKQGAVTITGVWDGDNYSKYFRLDPNGAAYDIICNNNNEPPVTFDANGRAHFEDTVQRGKVEISAKVEGYRDEYQTLQRFNIGIEYKEPKLKLTAVDKIIYTGIGMTYADLLIYEPNAQMFLNPDIAEIWLETDNSTLAARKGYSRTNAEFEVGAIGRGSVNEGNGVRLAIKDGVSAAGGTVKLSIRYDDWYSNNGDGGVVVASHNIAVKSGVPKVKIGDAKLNINTAKFVGKEQAAAAVTVSGAAGYDIEFSEALTPTSSMAAEMLDYIEYKAGKDAGGNNALFFSLKAADKDGTPFPAEYDAKRGIYKLAKGWPGKYSYKVSYKIGSVENTAVVSLALINNESISVSAKGSINAIDRKNSSVVITPKINGFTPAQAAGVTLKGEAAALFTVTGFDRATGAATIKAKDTANLKTGKYNVVPVYTYNLGKEGTASIQPLKPIRITVRQTKLKFTGLKQPLEVRLSAASAQAERTFTIAPAGAYIKDMRQLSGLENFELTYTGNSVAVRIKNTAGLKEGSSYKIQAAVILEGSASGVREQKINIPVKVLR